MARQYGYVPSRYDILKTGVFTIRAKALDREIGQATQMAARIAQEVDQLGTFDFEMAKWNYGQMYHCEVLTTEDLIECKLAECVWEGYWQGAYTTEDKLKDIVIYVSVDELEHGSRYAVAE